MEYSKPSSKQSTLPAVSAHALTELPPSLWPSEVVYLQLPVASPHLNDCQRKWLRRKPRPSLEKPSEAGSSIASELLTIRLPLTREDIDARIEVKEIQDEQHPAHGQLGYVHSNTGSEQAQYEAKQLEHNLLLPKFEESQTTTKNSDGHDGLNLQQHNPTQLPIGFWDTSEYDLNLYRDDDIELAVDASQIGNEARFCNDYRGVSAQITGEETKHWDRQSKRSARSWNQPEDATAIEDKNYYSMPNHIAMPNAEFRSVWLEWDANDDAEDHKTQPRSTSVEAAGMEQGIRDVVLSCASKHEQSSSKKEIKNSRNIQNKSKEAKHLRRQQRRNRIGMQGVAIFVLPAGKSGKRKHGIRAGQEVLVSYGKGFWAHHGSTTSA
ncbi:hypothetical protein LTR05_006172 [Lithohypha guttulata]|uniref:SET domain-containing protein n=1 Tax=Lithohypha guttulata TaxID=1690604 RepID=A0AAN7Y5I7_9EURO|nr:hypothetical protein LTR05_006172 [Lithohypha guttulata]